jgi:hypothetical protein
VRARIYSLFDAMGQNRTKKDFYGAHEYFEAKPQNIHAPRKVLFANEGAKRPMLRAIFNVGTLFFNYYCTIFFSSFFSTQLIIVIVITLDSMLLAFFGVDVWVLHCTANDKAFENQLIGMGDKALCADSPLMNRHSDSVKASFTMIAFMMFTVVCFKKRIPPNIKHLHQNSKGK